MGTVAEVVGIILVFGCAMFGRLTFRRVQLSRAGGVEVSLRQPRGSGLRGWRRWRLGMGRYVGDGFAWYPITGLRARPGVVLDRAELEITDRRAPSEAEEPLMPPSATVLACRDRHERVELAMSPDVLTGYLSWLQAGPPGQSTGYRQAS